MDIRFDEVAGQIDALLHRVLRLEDECTAITEGLARIEREVERLGAHVAGLEIGTAAIEATVFRLDERLSGVERRLHELVAAEPRYALREDVQDLKGRMDALHQRVDALEKGIDRK